MTRPNQAGALFKTVLALLDAKRPCAVATVLRADRSTPVPAGARAIIEADGRIHGTVGGGAVEAEAQRQAKSVLQTGTPAVFEFDLGGPGVNEPEPICGGVMRLLVAPSTVASPDDYRRAAAGVARRERGVWQTTLRHGRLLWVAACYLAEGDFSSDRSPVSSAVLADSLEAEVPELVAVPATAEGGLIEVFLEPVRPDPVLVIVGGGHVGQALAAQAALLGFDIVVIEDRPEFADPALFGAGVKTRCGFLAEEIAAIPVDHDTCIVIVTRGHQLDSIALRACIRGPAGYIGMIGSRRKVPLLRQQFLDNGWATPKEFDRVYAPVGLDIGAVTVPEIATSIMAQIIAVRRKGRAPRMPRK